MGNEPGSDVPKSPSQVQRGLNFLAKRASGLYFRDIIRNQQEILRRQEALAEQLRQGAQPRQMVYLGNHKVLTRMSSGHKIVLDSRDRSLFPHIAFEGQWESWVTKVMRDSLRPGMTVVDAGANVGYFTLIACDSVGREGRVFAFEPDPETYEVLFQNVEMNGYRPICQAHRMALSSGRGTATFYRFSVHFGGNSLWHGGGATTDIRDEVNEVQVETIAFDDFVADARVKAVDFVKIDTEGSEAVVLQGMRKTLADNPAITLLCEFNAERIRLSNCDPEASINSILEAGFKLRLVEYDGSIRSASRAEVLVHPDAMLFLRRGEP